ncbi:hypothetical protein PI124_g23805, partial [Phytophthora idaei]
PTAAPTSSSARVAPASSCPRNTVTSWGSRCRRSVIKLSFTPSTPTVPSATTQTPATGSCQGSGGDRKPSHAEATVPSGRGNVFAQSMDSTSACVAMQRRTLRTDSTIFVCSTRSGTSRVRSTQQQPSRPRRER